MQLHELKPSHKPQKGKRIGRGGKKGTFSGKGVKGQNSRAGRKKEPIIRRMIKRYPKLRGYKFKGFQTAVEVLNIEVLEKKFNDGDKVNPQILLEKKIVRRIKGKSPLVKILGGGALTKKLTVEGCEISAVAKEKIEKAGGAVTPKVQKPKPAAKK